MLLHIAIINGRRAGVLSLIITGGLAHPREEEVIGKGVVETDVVRVMNSALVVAGAAQTSSWMPLPLTPPFVRVTQPTANATATFGRPSPETVWGTGRHQEGHPVEQPGGREVTMMTLAVITVVAGTLVMVIGAAVCPDVG